MHKASTRFKNEKKAIFYFYFSYLSKRTLSRKQLERHQCQWLDTLCKLECERASVMFIALCR